MMLKGGAQEGLLKRGCPRRGAQEGCSKEGNQKGCSGGVAKEGVLKRERGCSRGIADCLRGGVLESLIRLDRDTVEILGQASK